MKSVTIARNYAEALFAAGDKFGGVLDAVAGAIQGDERIAITLDSPRVSKAAKAKILEQALKGEVPIEFVRFLQAVVRRGRQGLLTEIGTEKQVVERLAKALGREVRAYFRSDPRILGGVVVRVGDRIYDGSVRRRLTALQRRMLTGE